MGCQGKFSFQICRPTGRRSDARTANALTIVRLSTPVITLNYKIIKMKDLWQNEESRIDLLHDFFFSPINLEIESHNY